MAYNEDNYRQNSNNFFGLARETNIFSIPKERFEEASRELQNEPDVVLLQSLDDLVLGMLKRPGYKKEVLEKTNTAQVFGCDFWANEIEVLDHKSRIIELSRALLDREKALGKAQEILSRIRYTFAKNASNISHVSNAIFPSNTKRRKLAILLMKRLFGQQMKNETSFEARK